MLLAAATPRNNTTQTLLIAVDMICSELPTETIQQILGDIGNDKKANLKAGTLSKAWLLPQRHAWLKTMTFKNEGDIIEFTDLVASPACTFPIHIACEDISFHGLTASMTGQGAAALAVILSRITTPRSLTIGIEQDKIPQLAARAMEAWKASLHELQISGGVHQPRTFFATLSSLPHLERLTLQDFNFKDNRTWWGQEETYAFPATLKTLSIVGDASVFQFFQESMISSGGFSHITALSIHTRFLLEDSGILAALDVLRSLRTIPTIKLRPTYDPTCRDLARDMRTIFSSEAHPLLKIRGLKNLEIDLCDTPAEWALNCLAICAVFLPNRRKGLNVDIRVPRSLDLWDEQGPAVQLEQLLEEVDYPNPLANGESESTLVIRDFPAALPERFREAPTVCGFPVIFVDEGV